MTLDRLNDPILSCSKLAPYSNCKAFWQWQHCGDAKQRALTVDMFVLSKRIRCAILWVIDMKAIPIVCSPYGHWSYDWECSGSLCRCLLCRFISLHVLLFDILDRVSPQEGTNTPTNLACSTLSTLHGNFLVESIGPIRSNKYTLCRL